MRRGEMLASGVVRNNGQERRATIDRRGVEELPAHAGSLRQIAAPHIVSISRLGDGVVANRDDFFKAKGP
jgi:hypothetical protein